MERRRFKRIIVGFKAELISGGISYAGVVENLSEDGICVITAPTKTTIDCNPGTILELNFQPPSGKTLNLHCKLKWSYKTPLHGLTNRMGMEIIDLPWDRSDYFL